MTIRINTELPTLTSDPLWNVMQRSWAHYNGDGCVKNETKAVELAREAMVSHCPLTRYDVAKLFCLVKDEAAVDIIENLCEEDFSLGFYLKGMLFYKGLFYPHDLNKAVECWQDGARLGHLFSEVQFKKIQLRNAGFLTKPYLSVSLFISSLRAAIINVRQPDDIRGWE